MNTETLLAENAALKKMLEISESTLHQTINTMINNISQSLHSDIELIKCVDELDDETMRYTLIRIAKKLKRFGIQ